MLERASAPRPWAPELEEHLAACAECGHLARRMAAVAHALSGLERRPAPAGLGARVRAEISSEGAERRVALSLESLRRLEAPKDLEGRVVSAFHAGHRQERAVSQLRALPGQRAPAELDGRLQPAPDGGPGPGGGAPHELSLRVDADLRAWFRQRCAGPARGRRASDRRAPTELPPGQRSLPGGRWSWVAGLVAAAVLGWAVRSSIRDVEQGPRELAQILVPGIEFRAYAVESAGEGASETTRQILSGLTGGLLEAATPAPGLSEEDARRRALVPRSPRRAPGGDPALGGSATPDPQERGRELHSTSVPLLARIPGAPERTHFRGERVVRMADPWRGSTAQLVLRERVLSDGAGRFAIDPVGVASAPPGSLATSDFFRTMQKAREGFFFRHRDFIVRDLDLLHASYQVRTLSSSVEVAGRPCALLDVRRARDAERRYEVAIDVETGLVMRFRELWIEGDRLLASVEFESLELNAPIDPTQLTGGPSAWVEFDPAGGPPPGCSFLLGPPSFLPEGYVLERASTRLVGGSEPWIEYIFVDGVEELFLLHSAAPQHLPLDQPSPTSLVRASALGAWTVLEGEVRGTPIVAAGKLDVGDLLLFVQSALD